MGRDAFALHLPLLFFSLGMGSFAFLGREKVLARTGTKNYLLASPALQPLTNPTAHFAYYVKDLTYYVMLILTPVISGMAIGILLENFTNVSTPLEFSSLPRTWIAMSVTLAQGLAFSFHRFFTLAVWWLVQPINTNFRNRSRYRYWSRINASPVLPLGS